MLSLIRRIVALATHGGVSAFGLLRSKLGTVAAVAALLLVALLSAVQGQATLRNWFYRPWAASDYAMGRAIAARARPGDLVVVLGTTTGDTTAIYYSGLRGWPFPPWAGADRLGEPVTDAQKIAQLERLRSCGADWFASSLSSAKCWSSRPQGSRLIAEDSRPFAAANTRSTICVRRTARAARTSCASCQPAPLRRCGGRCAPAPGDRRWPPPRRSCASSRWTSRIRLPGTRR